MNRRHGRSTIEDPENSDPETESDSDDEKPPERSADIKFYVLVVLTIIFAMSYLYERDLRVQLIEEFNSNMEKVSMELLDAKQNSGSAGSMSLVGSAGSFASGCPRCPVCAQDADTVQEVEQVLPSADIEATLKQWEVRDKAMASEIQSLSRELLQLKFGSPPYYVQLDIQVDKEGFEGGKLVFEMAPIEFMPYSVLFFLNQVANGAWNSCG